jgi:hypothetical protein
VAHICNPSYSSGRDQKNCGVRAAWINSKTPSQSMKSWVWWHTPTITAIREM